MMKIPRKRSQLAPSDPVPAPSAAKVPADIDHIKDLKTDGRNARRHNPRNIGMIENALNEVGAARSIVIDEGGNILAGNGTVEAAAQAGITRVKVVEADGNEIVAVRRRGLTARQKQRLALYDNRSAELADWEVDVVKQIVTEDAKALEGMFAEDEVARMLSQKEPPADFPSVGSDIATDYKCPKCGYKWSGKQA